MKVWALKDDFGLENLRVDERPRPLPQRGQVLLAMHDPNAIDTLHFSVSLAFVWPAIAKPRQRRLPVR